MIKVAEAFDHAQESLSRAIHVGQQISFPTERGEHGLRGGA